MRNTKLDNKPLPTSGYYWSPAVADDFILCQAAKRPSNEWLPNAESKRVGAHSYYVHKGFGKTLVTNVKSLDLTTIGIGKKHISMLGQDSLAKCEFALYNAHTATKNSKYGRDLIREKSWCIQDSGGFQLATGVADFVDPNDTAKMHNLYADSGVSLDLPLSSTDDESVVLAGARMLAANSHVIKPKLEKSVQLMNVSHGATLKLRKQWMDVVLEEPLDSICVAGLRAPATLNATTFDKTSPTAFASHVLVTVLRTQDVYQHYHVLGVATGWQMALLAIIAKVFDKTVTSDSASHALSGKSGILYGYGGEANYKLNGRVTDNWLTTQCSCNVCTYLERHYWLCAGVHWFSQLHNLNYLHTVATTMRGIVDVAFAQKWHPHKMTQLLIANSGYLDTRKSRAFEHAVQLILKTTKLSDLKEPHVNHSVGAGSLFGQTKSAPQRFIEVIKRYESYHKTKFFA